MCPEVDLASESEYQGFLLGKRRPVRLARDFLFYVVLCVPAQLVCVSPLPVILLALSMEENVRTCGPAHVLGNTPLVPLLENSHFCCGCGRSCAVVFLCVVFRGVGVCTPLVRCALLRFCASVDYLLLVLICKVWTQVSRHVATVWTINMYALCKSSDLFLLTEIAWRGTAGFCVVVADLLCRSDFHFQRGWMPPHNWVMF